MCKKTDIYKGLYEQCKTCMHDCKNCCNEESKCNNRIKANRIEHYWDLIREQNVNLKRFCEDYGLKYNYLMKMLYKKMIMPYKYHACLEKRLHEVDEFYFHALRNEVSV